MCRCVKHCTSEKLWHHSPIALIHPARNWLVPTGHFEFFPLEALCSESEVDVAPELVLGLTRRPEDGDDIGLGDEIHGQETVPPC